MKKLKTDCSRIENAKMSDVDQLLALADNSIVHLCLLALKNAEVRTQCLDWQLKDYWSEQWALMSDCELPVNDAIEPFFQFAGVVLFNHGKENEDSEIIACAAKPPYSNFVAIRHMVIQHIREKKFAVAVKIAEACASKNPAPGYFLLADVYFAYGRKIESEVVTSAVQFYQTALMYLYAALQLDKKSSSFMTAAFLGNTIMTLSGYNFDSISAVLSAFKLDMFQRKICLNEALAQEQATLLSAASNYPCPTEVGKKRPYSHPTI